jgi:hypothetical protein
VRAKTKVGERDGEGNAKKASRHRIIGDEEIQS